jgi:hypothetical protein
MSEIEVGTVIGGVRIDAVVGRGGMGVVYRGQQLALNRTVAVKVVRGDLAENEEFRARFKREAENAASLDHPHIVAVYAAGEDEQQLYVTMRFVDGADLGELIAERGRLDPAFAVEVVAQIGAALNAAHRRGLVHRDVKPANIVVATEDDQPHAYLMDFGLSRAADSQPGMTRTGTVIGSLDYMAPEQFEGGPVDGRVDVYALGCVLYQALTGEVPFPRDTEPAKIWAHMNQPPPRLAATAPELAAGLGAVVQKAMAKKPTDRYATAGELSRAAAAALAEPAAVEPAPAASAETVAVELPDLEELAAAAPGSSGADPAVGSTAQAAEQTPAAQAPAERSPAAEPEVDQPGPDQAPDAAAPSPAGRSAAGESSAGGAPAGQSPQAARPEADQGPARRGAAAQGFPARPPGAQGRAASGPIAPREAEQRGMPPGGQSSPSWSPAGPPPVADAPTVRTQIVRPSAKSPAAQRGSAGPPPPTAPSTSGPVDTSPPPARSGRRALVVGVAVAVVVVAAVAAVVFIPRGGTTPPGAPAPVAAGTVIGQPIAVGKEPLDIDAGAGFLWTANASDGTISKIDPAAGTSQQIPVGGTPAELAVSDDGSVWVRNFPDAVTRVDAASGQVDQPVDVRRPIDAIAAGGGFLWLSHSDTDSVSRINLLTHAVEGGPSKVGGKPVGLAWGDRRLGERRLFVVDTADHTLTTVDGASAKALDPPLALDGDLGRIEEYQGVLYVGTGTGVIPVDERSKVVGDQIPLKGGSLFAPDAQGLWVAYPLQNELRRVDLQGAETRGTPLTGVGRGTGDMIVVDGVLWVTNSDDSTVTRIQVS